MCRKEHDMTTTHLDVLDRSVEKAHVWINDVAAELETDDRHEAYRVLRAFLHALRDALQVNESAQLAAQMPLLIRGIYYDGWNPSRTPRRYHGAEEFCERVRADALLHGDTEASYAVAAAARVLARHVSPGEIDDILATLPASVGALVV
jgi:uncharacterized protein (DUF2267 family)